MRRTKIIATIGPASDSAERIEALIAAGVDVFRINFSHGSRDTQHVMHSLVRDAASRVGRTVAIMQDLSGPKIRIGRLRDGEAVTLTAGAQFRIVTGEDVGDAARVSTTFEELAHLVSSGTRLLLDDGRIELSVTETDGREISTRVTHGGTLGEHKGINAPGLRFAASGLTQKDVDDLRFGLELGVDLVAVSFVQTAADLVRARTIADEMDSPVWLVAKIERPQAVDDIEAILRVTDAIMVARGDLGLEIPLEQLPRVQKHLTTRARAHLVPVIVATQVLESMRVSPTPTRAEVNDAANAVDDGVDAIMLAGETAVGDFPTQSVTTLDAIIRDAESIQPSTRPTPDPSADGRHGRALCEAAVTLAHRSNATAIVAVTHAGSTARQLAALRPRMPVYGVTEDPATARRLMLCWGVVPFATDEATVLGPAVSQSLVSAGALDAEATVVIVRIHADVTKTDANFVSLQRLSGV